MFQELSEQFAAAIRNGDSLICKMFVESGWSNVELNDSKDRPLHIAARSGEVGVVEKLLVSGALTRRRNKSDMTPALIASLHGNTEVLGAIIHQDKGVLLDTHEFYGGCLNAALFSGRLDTLDLLLDAYRKKHGDYNLFNIMNHLHSISVPCRSEMKTENLNLFMYAAMKGNKKIVELFLNKLPSYYRKLLFDKVNLYGKKPLYYAIYSGNLEVVKICVDNGTMLNTVSRVDGNALQVVNKMLEDSRESDRTRKLQEIKEYLLTLPQFQG